MNKRIISFIMSLCLVLSMFYAGPAAAYAADPDCTVRLKRTDKLNDQFVVPGDYFVISVELGKEINISNLSLDIQYSDSVFELVNVTKSSINANYTHSENINTNPYTIDFTNESGVSCGGVLAELGFIVTAGAVTGSSFIGVSFNCGPLGDYVDGRDVNYDADHNSLNLKYKGINLIVSDYVPGDVDSNGIVDYVDVIKLLRYCAKWNIDINLDAADANGDERVNSYDAVHLMRYLAGWDVELSYKQADRYVYIRRMQKQASVSLQYIAQAYFTDGVKATITLADTNSIVSDPDAYPEGAWYLYKINNDRYTVTLASISNSSSITAGAANYAYGHYADDETVFLVLDKDQDLQVYSGYQDLPGTPVGEYVSLSSVKAESSEYDKYVFIDASGLRGDMVPTGSIGSFCGDNAYWYLSGSALVISGTGATYDYADVIDAPWYSSQASIETIIVSEGITEIGTRNIRFFDNLETVFLPDSLLIINGGNWEYCSKLRTFYIPANLSNLGSGSCFIGTIISEFNVDSNNPYYYISASSGAIYEHVGNGNRLCWYPVTSSAIAFVDNGATTIGVKGWAFYNNPQITDLYLPASVKELYSLAFMNSVSLSSIYYDGTVASWAAVNKIEYTGSSTFYWVNNMYDVVVHCSDGDVNFFYMGKTSGQCGENAYWSISGGALTISGSGAMYDYPNGDAPWLSYRFFVDSIIVQEGITRIGNRAFHNMNNASSVSLPSSLRTIGWNAFRSIYNITSITIPSNVVEIQGPAQTFADCLSLQSILVDNNNPYYESVDGVLYMTYGGIRRLCSYPSGKAGTIYEIPNDIFETMGMVFTNNTSLTSITIPASVGRIPPYLIQKCPNLNTVYYLGTVASWNAIDFSVSSGDYQFCDNDNLKIVCTDGVVSPPSIAYSQQMVSNIRFEYYAGIPQLTWVYSSNEPIAFQVFGLSGSNYYRIGGAGRVSGNGTCHMPIVADMNTSYCGIKVAAVDINNPDIEYYSSENLNLNVVCINNGVVDNVTQPAVTISKNGQYYEGAISNMTGYSTYSVRFSPSLSGRNASGNYGVLSNGTGNIRMTFPSDDYVPPAGYCVIAGGKNYSLAVSGDKYTLTYEYDIIRDWSNDAL